MKSNLRGKFAVGVTVLTLVGTSFGSSVLAATSYSAKSINELRAEQERLKEVAEEKRKEAAEEANIAEAAKKKLASLESNIAVAENQIKQTESTINETESSISSLTSQITDKESSITQKREYIEQTLRKFFKMQVTREHAGYIALAFSKDGISQKVRELQGYSAMKRELARQQEELDAERVALANNRTELEEKKGSLLNYKQQKEVQQQDLAVQQNQQEQLKSSAEVAYAQLKKEEKAAISEEARVEAAIVQQIQAQLRGSGIRASGSGTPVAQGNVIGHLGSTGFSTGPHVHFTVFTPEGATVNPRTRLGSNYIWPVTDYVISQEYGPAGWRNPVYSFHNGIDLAGPAGQSVYAAADGKIILDQYYGGYGNAVVIEHNDGWLTLYGHMTGK